MSRAGRCRCRESKHRREPRDGCRSPCGFASAWCCRDRDQHRTKISSRANSNILTGFGETAGAALAPQPDFDKVAFTSSSEVGKLIVQAAAGNLKKVSLELGGKSPAIILPDADLDVGIAGPANAIFFNRGQYCCAGSRLFAHRTVYDLDGVCSACHFVAMSERLSEVETELRIGEVAVELPSPIDAGIFFIGTIHTPWCARRDCPKRGSFDGPVCAIVVDARWRAALTDIDGYRRIQVLYWMHEARRDLLLQTPFGSKTTGTFALRSPVRPNPIASSIVELVGIEGATLQVRGLDCVDGTPLLDLKPDYPTVSKES